MRNGHRSTAQNERYSDGALPNYASLVILSVGLSEMVQEYHRRGHFSRENFAIAKRLCHATKFRRPEAKKLVKSTSPASAFSWYFRHLLFESVISWTLTGLLPNFGAIVRPLPVPILRKASYTEPVSTKTTGFTTKGRLL
ncbi:MAG: hypothetical protein ACLR8U_04010 [Oscillospiraceae bacterium]|nr:hypothetical protein [Bacillota bacterium]